MRPFFIAHILFERAGLCEKLILYILFYSCIFILTNDFNMVRNLKGGSGTKALARKHQTSSKDGNIRLPSCNAEQFAFVSKMFGHGMCEVFINDDTKLTAHIRNKFRGRQKRQNMVSSSSIVLVGLREWETTPTNCDLLCVYDNNDIISIKSLPNAPHNLFKRIDSSDFYSFSSDNLVFENIDHHDDLPIDTTISNDDHDQQHTNLFIHNFDDI